MKTLLIARREYLAFVKTVGFWLSLLTLPLLMVGSAFIPVMMARNGEAPRSVAVLDLSGQNLTPELEAMIRDGDPSLKKVDLPESVENDAVARTMIRNMARRGGFRLVPLPVGLTPDLKMNEAEARIIDLMKAEKPPVDHILVASVAPGTPEHLTFRIWSPGQKGDRLAGRLEDGLTALQFRFSARKLGLDPAAVAALADTRADIQTLTPAVATATDSKQASFLEKLKENGPRIVGVALSYLTWMAIFSSSVILLSGVIEEKSSKVLEVLLTSAPASSLLVGKVLGVFMVMATVAGVWGAVGTVAFGYGLAFMPPEQLMHIRAVAAEVFAPLHMLPMLAYFVGGYLMYGITFIAIGSFCETQKEAQAIMGPIVIVLMIPMMTLQAAMMSPDLPFVRYLSWVPFFTPFLMPLRLLSGAPWWEVLATLAGMGLLAFVMIRLGARAFKQGALGGGKFSWKAMLGLSRG